MKITCHGAARTTTGSMHEVEAGGVRVLLDCGLYQGKRKEAFERNRNLPFTAAALHAVALSHAHIDHSGNLPSLVRAGYAGPIFCTEATRDLCEFMLKDSARLQAQDLEYVNRKREKQGKVLFEPLYTEEDVDAVLRLMRPVPYGRTVAFAPGIRVSFHEAGHIIGAAQVLLELGAARTPDDRVLFSGDIGPGGMPLLRDPAVVEGAGTILMESTYGSRIHPPPDDIKGRIKGFIDDIRRQRAKLLIPAFSVGRTQQLLYYLEQLCGEGRIPGIPVYVDSPMSTKASAVYERHSGDLNPRVLAEISAGARPFHFRCLQYTGSREDSMKLNTMEGPAIIISASGMCEGGRILHHLKHSLGNPRTILLFAGYQAENTLGRRLVDGAEVVRVFGEEVRVEARIHTLNALSAHADRDGLLGWFDRCGAQARQVLVIHGEPEENDALAGALRGRTAARVLTPVAGEGWAA